MPADWPDFPSHERIGDASPSYAEHAGVGDRIRSATPVEHAERGTGGGWELDRRGRLQRALRRTSSWPAATTGSRAGPTRPTRATSPATSSTRTTTASPTCSTGRRVLVVGIGNCADGHRRRVLDRGRPHLLSTRSGTRIVPKYVFGKPADQTTSPTMARLPWQLRQPLTHAMLRVAVGRPETYGLPAPSGGFLRGAPHDQRRDPVAPDPRRDQARARDRASSPATRWCSRTAAATSRRDRVVHRLPGHRAVRGRLACSGPRRPSCRCTSGSSTTTHDDLFFIGLVQTTGSAIPVVERQCGAAGRPPDRALRAARAAPPPRRRRAAAGAARPAATARTSGPHLRVEFDGFMRELADRAATARPARGPRAAEDEPRRWITGAGGAIRPRRHGRAARPRRDGRRARPRLRRRAPGSWSATSPTRSRPARGGGGRGRARRARRAGQQRRPRRAGVRGRGARRARARRSSRSTCSAPGT